MGIHLSKPIIPTDLTVEHIPREIAHSDSFKSAPRKIQAWAIFGQAQLFRWPDSQEQFEKLIRQPNPSLAVLLAEFEYDIQASPIQTFPIPLDVVTHLRKMNSKVENAVFRIQSNWGEEQYSCLYRVRIHGVE